MNGTISTPFVAIASLVAVTSHAAIGKCDESLIRIESLQLLVADSDTGVDQVHLDIEVDANRPGTGGRWIVDLGESTRVLKIEKEFTVTEKLACRLYRRPDQLIATIIIRADQQPGDHQDFFEATRGVYKLTWKKYESPIVVDDGVVILAVKPSRVWVHSDPYGWGKYEKYGERWKHTQEIRGASRPIIKNFKEGKVTSAFVELRDGDDVFRLYRNAATAISNGVGRLLYRGAWLKQSASGGLMLTDDETEITFDDPSIINVSPPGDTSRMSDDELREWQRRRQEAEGAGERRCNASLTNLTRECEKQRRVVKLPNGQELRLSESALRQNDCGNSRYNGVRSLESSQLHTH